MTLAIKTAYQTQSLAIGDGENLPQKFPENPVILATNSQKASINQILETLKSGSKMVNIGWLQVI